MRMMAIVGMLLASLTTIGATPQGNPEAAKIKNPVAATPESIAAGKQVYPRYCAVCHGTNGEGGSGSDISAPAPDLTDKEWKRGSTDGEIFYVIKNGVPPDSEHGALGRPNQGRGIWNVVNYVQVAWRRRSGLRAGYWAALDASRTL